MKVQVEFTATLVFAKEVEMTQEEFDDWDAKTTTTSSFGTSDTRRAAQKLFNELGFIQVDGDMDDVELDTFTEVKEEKGT